MVSCETILTFLMVTDGVAVALTGKHRISLFRILPKQKLKLETRGKERKRARVK